MGVMERIRVRVVGAGAIGSLLGGLLSLGGHEVFFSGNEDELQVPARTGLRLILPSGWWTCRPFRLYAGEAVDLVLVTVRRHHLRQLARLHRGKPRAGLGIAPGEWLLALNCDVEDLLPFQAGGSEPPLLGLTLLDAVRIQPSDVELCTETPALIWPKCPPLAWAFSVLRAYGFELVETDDIVPLAHSFFLWKLLDLPAALCGTTRDHLLSFPEGRELAKRVLEEGVTVLTRCKKKLARLPRMDPQELLKRLYRGGLELEAGCFRADRSYGSLLQSVYRKRALETQELNGRLVRMGSEVGVEARWNRQLVQRMDCALKHGLYPDPAQLLEAMK